MRTGRDRAHADPLGLEKWNGLGAHIQNQSVDQGNVVAAALGVGLLNTQKFEHLTTNAAYKENRGIVHK